METLIWLALQLKHKSLWGEKGGCPFCINLFFYRLQMEGEFSLRVCVEGGEILFVNKGSLI